MARAKIGDVEFNVITSEEVEQVAESTDHAVESGSDITDHVKIKATFIEIAGLIAGDDASNKLQKLKKYQKVGEQLHFISRNSYKDIIISRRKTIHSYRTSDGFEFSMTLKQIQTSKAKEVEINVVEPVTKKPSPRVKTKVKKPTNNGRQQPKQKTISPTSPVLAKNFFEGASVPSMSDLVDIYKGGI